jgi:hypothetical protein
MRGALATSALVVGLFVIAAPAAAEIRGSWTGSSEDGERIHLSISRRHNQNSQTMRVSEFAGLTGSQILSATVTPVQFALQREAGSISFEGTFRDGYGGGQFSFTPNRRYLEAIRSLGVPAEDLEGSESLDETLMQLALHDVSTAFIRSMQAEGYRVSLEKYVAMRIFRVTPELVREFRAVGFDKVSADDLISSQIHKVTPAYAREMRAAGFSELSLDQLVSSRIHKATPEFVAEMKALGYDSLDFDDVISFRIHKVTPEFVRELRELGYSGISADKLVAMRIHRVTPSFIRELKEAGYANVPVDKLISMRIHGIDVDFVKKMNKVQ